MALPAIAAQAGIAAQQAVDKAATQVADKASVTVAQVADKAVDKIGNFVDMAASKAGNIFEAAYNILDQAIKTYGKDVVDAVLWVVRIDALQSLITWWLAIFLSIGCLYYLRTGFTKRNWGTWLNKTADGIMPWVPVVISAIASCLFIIIGFFQVTDVWKYTAVVKPELYLAKQAVDIVRAKFEAPKAQPK